MVNLGVLLHTVSSVYMVHSGTLFQTMSSAVYKMVFITKIKAINLKLAGVMLLHSWQKYYVFYTNKTLFTIHMTHLTNVVKGFFNFTDRKISMQIKHLTSNYLLFMSRDLDSPNSHVKDICFPDDISE